MFAVMAVCLGLAAAAVFGAASVLEERSTKGLSLAVTIGGIFALAQRAPQLPAEQGQPSWPGSRRRISCSI